jgi:glycosyltransferase involved in cell wall biosynthesis
MILDCMLGNSFGGLEKVFIDQLYMLPAAGMPVVGVARRNSPAAQRAQAAGLPCEGIPSFSDWDPFSLGAARAAVRRHKPTLLLCHGRKAHRMFAHATRDDPPIVAMVHKPRFDRNLPYAGVIVVAEHRKASLVADGVPAKNIVVVPNAVSLPASPKVSYGIALGTAATIVGLGRLHEKKGFSVLVEALKILGARHTNFACTIAGEGPMRNALTQEIERAGLSASVRLAGWTDKPAEFLAAADIFAFPSLQEDFPLAVLDAMAAGLPIVSSRIDGPKDFLTHEETALLVPPNDPAALAEALQQMILDESLRARLGGNARRMAEQRYSFAAISKRLAAALNNVASSRPIGDNL